MPRRAQRPVQLRASWTRHVIPAAGSAEVNGGTPWSGSTYGFPQDDLQLLRTTQNGQGAFDQVFDNSGVMWQPKGCPSFVPSCPSAGPTYCTTYGTLSTNYIATDLNTTVLCYPQAREPGWRATARLCPSVVRHCRIALAAARHQAARRSLEISAERSRMGPMPNGAPG